MCGGCVPFVGLGVTGVPRAVPVSTEGWSSVSMRVKAAHLRLQVSSVDEATALLYSLLMGQTQLWPMPGTALGAFQMQGSAGHTPIGEFEARPVFNNNNNKKKNRLFNSLTAPLLANRRGKQDKEWGVSATAGVQWVPGLSGQCS